MLTIREREVLRQLLENRTAISEIARQTGRSVGTIYNYQKSYGIIYPPKKKRSSVHKLYRTSTNRPYKPAIRIETPPGEQAQVDWGTFGTITIDGKKVPLHGFFYILSYSRALYVEFTSRQDQQTLQECHIHAFQALGIPKIIRYDNMKTVVISHKRHVGQEPTIQYNSTFLDFAQYYNFTPEACPPYWPRAKGKVEASVKYIRYAFIQNLDNTSRLQNFQELNDRLSVWLRTVANERIHRTTRERPSERHIKELQYLRQIDGIPTYTTSPIANRRSTKDGMVAYKSSSYSIPMEYAGKQVFIKEQNQHGQILLKIYRDDKEIAQHKLSREKGSWIFNDKHHTKELKTEKRRVKVPRDKNIIDVASRPLSYYDNLIGDTTKWAGQK
jgi:transposase